VLMLSALASSLKLTFGSSETNMQQSLLPPSHDAEANSAESRSTAKLQAHAQPHWWDADIVYLVTQATDPLDPASASPVLTRTMHGEILAVFEVFSLLLLHSRLSSCFARTDGCVVI
jgi:hypothetical protein